MSTIVKYVLSDLLKNKIILVYTFILAALAVSVLSLDGNAGKGLLSLLNLTLLFVPIITILFSTIYLFNSVEFIELLLAQPVNRKHVLLAEFSGIALSLSAAYILGIGVPLLLLLPALSSLVLLVSGIMLTVIFVSISLFIFVLFRDKTKGIGVAIITVLFFALLFDGLLLAFIYSFNEYPIETALLGIITFNPIDLARVFMLLQLDIAVMMGYSGALFKKFLGTATGSMFALGSMLLWVFIPLLLSVRKFRKKDL